MTRFNARYIETRSFISIFKLGLVLPLRRKGTNARRCMPFGLLLEWRPNQSRMDRHGCQVFLRCHPDEMAGNEMRQSNRLINQPTENIKRHSLALRFILSDTCRHGNDRDLWCSNFLYNHAIDRCVLPIILGRKSKNGHKRNDQRYAHTHTHTYTHRNCRACYTWLLWLERRIDVLQLRAPLATTNATDTQIRYE